MNTFTTTYKQPTAAFVESHRLASQGDPQRAGDVIEQCRNHIHARMPDCAQSALSTFMRHVFSDDELVQAYLAPVSTPGRQLLVMPLDLCEHAAARASRYPGLLHRHERDLASVAAFVQSCAYYWCARNQASAPRGARLVGSAPVHRARIVAARQAFLEMPLRRLRLSSPELACTLAQVLGMNDDSPSDPHQVARIQAALGSAAMQTL